MHLRTTAALALFLFASAAAPQSFQPAAQPGLAATTQSDAAIEAEDRQRLDGALRALVRQRPGTVDAYVVAMALDSDPVFGREARVAGDVLQRRYDAAGRTLILGGSGEAGSTALPRGTPDSLASALTRISELMDEQEDVLVLYTSGHGSPTGLAYREQGNLLGEISPKQMRALLDRFAIQNRLLILSACFSGIFVPGMQSSNSVIVTAAARDRTSFGCVADNDWTFFGDAMINHALRRPQTLGAAYAEATTLVTEWETRFAVLPSRPQIFLGATSARWLGALERRMPAIATSPVGRPAVDTSSSAFTQR
jgi:hypothetical protein